MRLVGPAFLARFAGRLVNTHPSLLPAFPGMHAARDALAHGVKVTGCTLFVVDAGVDTGPIVAQVAVPVARRRRRGRAARAHQGRGARVLVDVVGRMAREGWSRSPDRKVTIP